MARYSRPKAAPATTPTLQPCLRERRIRGIISRETDPPKGILKSTMNPKTNDNATASAASVSTLVSLKAFKRRTLLVVCGGCADKRLRVLPAPALPGSGSAGRHLCALSASRLPGLTDALSVTYRRHQHHHPHSRATRARWRRR